MKKLTLLPLIAVGFSAPSAADFSLGLVSSYASNTYIGIDADVVVFPLVNYDNGQVFIEGTSLGYRLFENGSAHNVLFRATYDPRTLKPSDSDDSDIQLLDERKAAFLGSVAYQFTTKAGIFETGIGSDISSVHKGLYANASYRYPFLFSNYGVIPSIGYSYNSKKMNKHLYGVSEKEASLTRFDAFSPSHAGELSIGVSSYLYMTKSVRLTTSIQYKNLDSEIAKSPIIERREIVTGSLGISYIF